MRITDAQIHLWGQGLPSNDAHWQVTSFTAAEAITMMDEAGVDGAVIHPPPWDPDALQLSADAVRDYPGRFAILGGLPLDDGDAPAKVARWRAAPGNLGLRYLFIHEPWRTRFRDGTLDWLWREAEAAGVPIALLATDSLDTVGQIAERHPGLKLTIDHLGGLGGNTKAKDHEAMGHMDALVALARHPNITVKATGAPGYAGEAYPYPIMLDYIHRVFDAFGPERVFWGTDISKMPCTWRQCLAMFTDEMPWLSGADRSLVMGEAVRAWWGWSE